MPARAWAFKSPLRHFADLAFCLPPARSNSGEHSQLMGLQAGRAIGAGAASLCSYPHPGGSPPARLAKDARRSLRDTIVA